MKKFSIIMALAVLLFGFGCKKDKISREGIVNFVAGTVQLIDGGKKTQANIGDVLKEGMKVETAAASMAEIFIGENAIKVLENSLCEVSRMFTDKKKGETTEFYVEKGKLFSRVQKKLLKTEEYIIKSPTAVASVRGTDFLVSEKDGKGNIACLNGKVEVASSDGKKVDIEGGQEVDIEKGKAPMVKAISLENRQNMQKIIQDFKEMREDIRKSFEKQRDEIRQMMEDTRAANRKMVEDQKALDKANIDAIKGTADETKSANKGEVDKAKDDQKKLLDSVKNPMEDFKKGIK